MIYQIDIIIQAKYINLLYFRQNKEKEIEVVQIIKFIYQSNTLTEHYFSPIQQLPLLSFQGERSP